MTYIEFFDKTASENICACLTYAPERVIYIGDNAKLMRKHIDNYRAVFAARGKEIEFLYKTTSQNNLENAMNLLEQIVLTYDDCVFDITGGEEILTLALGVVYARHPEKNIQIHKFNLRNNAIYDCDKDGQTVYKEPPTLSIDENMKIYGGEVVYGSITENLTYKWDLNPMFVKDIEKIWSVCRGNVRLWNTQIGVLEAAEAVKDKESDSLTTVASIPRIQVHLAKYKADYKIIKGIITRLCKLGLICAFDDSDGVNLRITYKNEQVKKCLTKAGQALEMKTYITACSLTDEEGNAVYDDALNGVVIDWDGEFHDESVEKEYDTENEIDIVLMHDMVPVFISCKNGIVTADELYKLNTVAERFGGQYSKKVLVATSISDFGEQGKYLRQRAKDMNIKLIEGVQTLDDAELKKKLKNIWNN